MKEYNQSVSELPHVQYSENTAFHWYYNCTAFSVYFGRKPADLVTDLSQPSEAVPGLETKDQLHGVLECRQVIEFVLPTSSAATTTLAQSNSLLPPLLALAS
eukprot:TRINITY_DN30377_c0_g1_i1.p1 TRINITY_DN30377_c0_g1~~TRINITY_DN30377_c0_g1_i1.p1  ORF type:complete len:102 (-),score=3.65 TRINITY_DN30377_c0_g1_i1:101-406(-)